MALQISSGNRRLPEDRTRPTSLEFGFREPETIRPGRCSIRQALSFLSEHRTDPDEVGSAESIARRYNLDVERVNNVVTHFGVFNVEKLKSLTDGLRDKDETQFSVKVADVTSDMYKKIWSTVRIIECVSLGNLIVPHLKVVITLRSFTS